ncbi:2-oxoglutarate dehydrogenase complex dihydrolipoyllysine-residue succinyltransferase [Kaarinaea lacus]
MLVEVKVPVLAESVTEATLVTWNKQPGDYVQRNDNLVDMETDKVMLEIVAPNDGVLKEIVKGDGATVGSNDVIAVIDTEAAQAKSTTPAAEPVTSATVKNIREAASAKSSQTIARPAAVSSQSVSDMNLSPAVRKLVADNQLDPHLIKGSGKDGRIVKGDVLEYLEHIQAEPVEEEGATEMPATVKSMPAPLPVASEEERLEKRVPMSRLRQRIAERLKEAQNTAAILTTFNEVNMKPVMDLRARYNDKFLERHKVKLGFMSFFTKVVVEALKQFPIINATTDGNDIIYHGYYDIGIAVGTPRGLVVPILRNVDSMSFADVELAIQDYGRRAKEGRLSLEELTGGTFSISNGGVYGSMLSTPILNPPQSAILGMHNIVERPVVEKGEIVIRPMMYVALSYDHRIIDGHDAVLFLVAVKQLIEDPTRILLDI